MNLESYEMHNPIPFCPPQRIVKRAVKTKGFLTRQPGKTGLSAFQHTRKPKNMFVGTLHFETVQRKRNVVHGFGWYSKRGSHGDVLPKKMEDSLMCTKGERGWKKVAILAFL